MEKGLLASLFDFSFSSFVTTKLVRVLYGLSLAAIALAALVFGLGAFGRGFFSGLVGLFIVAPLGFLIALVIARINCELVLVAFRIQAHTAEIAERLRHAGPGTAS